MRNRYQYISGLLLLCLSTQSFSNSAIQDQIRYPATRRVEQTDTYHGVKVSDPYRWLEDMKSEEALRWAKAQDETTKRFVSQVTSRSILQKRLDELVRFDRYATPIKANGKYFFAKRAAGRGIGEGTLYVQESLTSKPQVLVDPVQRDQGGQLRLYAPSPDGRFVAYGISQNQSRWFDLKILNVNQEGQELPDKLTGLVTVSANVSWTKDSKGFFYTAFEKPKAETELYAVIRNPRVYYHKLGNPQSEDVIIATLPEKPNWLFSPKLTYDGRYLVIAASVGGSNENQILYRDLQKPGGKIESLIGEADANYTYLGNEGTHFYFYTDWKAPKGRLIAIDLKKPERKNWVELVAQAEEAISARDQTGGNALGMYGNRFVLVYIKDGKPLIRIYSVKGRLEREVNIPEGGSIWSGFSGTQTDPEVFYMFLGLADPSTIYRLDVASGRQSVFLRPKLNFNGDGYVVKQVFVQSKDGASIPMFITHKKGIKLDGNNPTWMYGYGAAGWIPFLWYRPDRLAWLEMGGVYALPGVRGGGEYGEAWHQAGVKLQEQNSIDDYLAAAEWLIKNNYTSPAKLVANGGSLSASLAGAAIQQRPELFGASIIDIPVADLLRFDKFTGGSYWLPDLGSPADAEEFKVLFSYSPYHNAKSGTCYPPTLIMVGERDQSAVPMHGYKLTAAMQAAQGCQHPILLKMMWGAAHNFGATLEQEIDSYVDELAFLIRVLKLEKIAANHSPS
jgi:prolyl oligopeptidase